jgi:LmbE family N-acetylglucosaminyl deacetylase
MNVLFVGAHPDDIETYGGGTAARYAQQGHRLFFCVATNGNVGSATLPKEEIAAIRHEEAARGAKCVGAELIWLGFDDEFLIDSVQTRHAFIEAFRIAKPDVVFCHWREDYNPDHSISGMIVDECIHMGSIPNIKTASNPTIGGVIPHVYFMDTPAGVNFSPEIYVDITPSFSTKVEMVRCHASQGSWMTHVFGYDMEAFLEIPARYRGLQAGCTMAEAFRPSYRWGRTFQQHYLPTPPDVPSPKK